MSSDLHDQIYRNMDLKETDELLEIWQTNDHVEWSDEAFEIVKEILLARGVALPAQDQPVYAYEEEDEGDEEDKGEDLDLSEAERQLLDDENPPAFYSPLEVLRLERWFGWAIKALFVAIPFSAFARFPFYQDLVQGVLFGFATGNPYASAISFILTFALLALDAAIGIGVYYLLLSSAARVLKILMQMEFNSRKALVTGRGASGAS